MKKTAAKFFIVFLLLFCGCRKKEGIEVHFLDAGYGDCIVIKSTAGNFLIDGGYSEQGKGVVEYLHGQGLERLDAVFATHAHPDHIGGLVYVLERFKVGKLYTNEPMDARSEWDDLASAAREKGLYTEVIGRGDVLVDTGGVRLEALHPEKPDSDLNASSLVLKMTAGEIDFLFTADITAPVLEELAVLYGEKLKSAVLKVPHHGKQPSKEFYRLVSPDIAVISTGKSQWRLPGAEQKVLSRLEEAAVQIFVTEQDGAIVIESCGKELRLKK